MKGQHLHLIVGNEKGVHSRVAMRLAEVSAEYAVTLQISRGDETADCASILDVLALALVQGTEIELQASGEKADQALLAAQKVVFQRDL